MTYTRPVPANSGPASSSDAAASASSSSALGPAPVSARAGSDVRRSSSDRDPLEEVHELWHYRARPSPKGTAPGPDGEHLWVAERMVQDASDAALASMRGEGKSGASKTRRKKNAVADVPASSPSF